MTAAVTARAGGAGMTGLTLAERPAEFRSAGLLPGEFTLSVFGMCWSDHLYDGTASCDPTIRSYAHAHGCTSAGWLGSLL